jgi:hypothetical protein
MSVMLNKIALFTSNVSKVGYSVIAKLSVCYNFIVDTGGRVREFNTYAIGKGFKGRNKFLSEHEKYYLSKNIGSEPEGDSENYKQKLVRLAIRALIEVNSIGWFPES